MDRIEIPDVPLRARVGVTDEERREPQELRVALVLHLDLAPAGTSDDLTHTVDYDAVCGTVARTVASRPFRLIEAVAEAVARAVLGAYAVDEVEVRVEKPGALRGMGVAYAAVGIRRRRDA
jgi:FolB domain-containing protein